MNAYKKAPGLVWLALLTFFALYGAMLIARPDPISPAQPSGPRPTPTPLPIQNAADLETAIQIWETVLVENPANAQAHYRLGLLLAVTDPAAAPAHLEQAAAFDPALQPLTTQMLAGLRRAVFFDSPAYKATLIGQRLAAIEEWELAQAALLNATLLDPDYAEAWAYLGEALQQTGEDGRSALETALQLDPQSAAANLLFSLYWRRQERPDLALDYVRTAVQIDPDNPNFLEALAHTLAETGDFTAGISQINRLAELSPQDPAAWMTIANFSLDHEVQVAAVGIPAARQAVILSPSDPAPLVALGRAYLLLGDDFFAQRFLDQAVALDPENPEVHLALGILYLNQEKFTAARRHLEAASALGAGTSPGEQALQILTQYLP